MSGSSIAASMEQLQLSPMSSMTGLQRMCLLAQMSTGGRSVDVALRELKAKHAARACSGLSFNGSISETPQGMGRLRSLNGSSSLSGAIGGGSPLSSSPAAATVNLLFQLSPSRAHTKCPPEGTWTDLQRYSCFIQAAASAGKLGSSFHRQAQEGAHSGALQKLLP